MKTKTLKIIVILVGLLFLNIEAAHAGLIHKFRAYIGHEFPGHQLHYIIGFTLLLAGLSYIIFTPAFREKGLESGYYRSPLSYQDKRSNIKKIAEILRDTQPSN